MPFTKVAKTSDLESGACMTVHVGERDFALYNVDGTFCATTNACPHRGGPLGEGLLEDKLVTCPWHSWQFDVTTGTSPTHGSATLKTFPVKVEGEDVLIDC